MPGSPLPIVPKDLLRLEGTVTLCGALAPEAVEETDEDCVMVFGRGTVPCGCGFCPGGLCCTDGRGGA
jgi:hypothetical protein